MSFKVIERATGNIMAECNSKRIAQREVMAQLEGDIIQGKKSDINSYLVVDTRLEEVYTIDDVIKALNGIRENITMDEAEEQVFSYYSDIIENSFHYLRMKLRESERLRFDLEQ